jgi:hypothetical protein
VQEVSQRGILPVRRHARGDEHSSYEDDRDKCRQPVRPNGANGLVIGSGRPPTRARFLRRRFIGAMLMKRE